jgi:hypothetical protein
MSQVAAIDGRSLRAGHATAAAIAGASERSAGSKCRKRPMNPSSQRSGMAA